MAASVALVADALALLVQATQAAATIAPIIQAAQAQGRTLLTDAEWKQIVGNDDSAMAALAAAIAAAKVVTPPAPPAAP